jgi:hypothetical protein
MGRLSDFFTETEIGAVCFLFVLAEPEALAVIEKNLDGGSLAIAEDKCAAGHRILLELDSADRGQAIDSPAEIDGLCCHEDLHGGARLDHDTTSVPHSARSTSGSRAVAGPFRATWTLRPEGSATSTTHSPAVGSGMGVSSMKSGVIVSVGATRPSSCSTHSRSGVSENSRTGRNATLVAYADRACDTASACWTEAGRSRSIARSGHALLCSERLQSPGRDERLSIVKTPDFATRVHCLVRPLSSCQPLG